MDTNQVRIMKDLVRMLVARLSKAGHKPIVTDAGNIVFVEEPTLPFDNEHVVE